MKIETVAPALDVTGLAACAGKISELMDERAFGLVVAETGGVGTLVAVARRDRDNVGNTDVLGVTVEEKARVVVLKATPKPEINIRPTSVPRGM